MPTIQQLAPTPLQTRKPRANKKPKRNYYLTDFGMGFKVDRRKFTNEIPPLELLQKAGWDMIKYLSLKACKKIVKLYPDLAPKKVEGDKRYRQTWQLAVMNMFRPAPTQDTYKLSEIYPLLQDVFYISTLKSGKQKCQARLGFQVVSFQVTRQELNELTTAR